MAIEFVKEVPPRTGGQGSEHEKIATALKERPNEWARVMKDAKTASPASTINTGGNAWYAPRGSFEATSRQTGKGKYDIYARYLGEAGVAAKAAKGDK